MPESRNTSRQVPSLVNEAVELARALTGQELPVSSAAGDLVGQLNRLGWHTDALASLREQRQLMGKPWPFPIPLEARREIGFARFDAALAQLRSELGLTGLQPSQAKPRELTADERRLLADRPPHW